MATNQEKFPRQADAVISPPPRTPTTSIQKPVRKPQAQTKTRAVPILPKHMPPVIPRAVPLAPRPIITPSSNAVVLTTKAPTPPSASDTMLPTPTPPSHDDEEPQTSDKPKFSRTRSFTEDDDLALILFWHQNYAIYCKLSKLSFARRATKHLNSVFETRVDRTPTHEKQVHNKMCYMIRRYDAVLLKHSTALQNTDTFPAAAHQADSEFLYFSKMYAFMSMGSEQRPTPRKRKNSRSPSASLPDLLVPPTSDEMSIPIEATVCDDGTDRVSGDNHAADKYTNPVKRLKSNVEDANACNASNDKLSSGLVEGIATEGTPAEVVPTDVVPADVVVQRNEVSHTISGIAEEAVEQRVNVEDISRPGEVEVVGAAEPEELVTEQRDVAVLAEECEVTEREVDHRERDLQMHREELTLREREVRRMEEELALKRKQLEIQREDSISRRDMELIHQLRECAKSFFDNGMTARGNKCLEKMATLLKL